MLAFTGLLVALYAISELTPKTNSSDVFKLHETVSVIAEQVDSEYNYKALLINIVLGIMGGIWVGLGNMFFENTAYMFFDFLGSRKFLRRLAPSIPETQDHYHQQSFICVSLPYCLVFFGVATYREGFIARAQMDYNVLSIFAFVWCTMTLHDFWFFVTHSLMHSNREIYHRMHALHHASRGDLNVFGTVLGEIPEIMLIFGVFYMGVFTYLYNLTTWNPLAFFALMFAVNGTNCLGHSGYDVPYWLAAVLSGGYLLTPGNATSKSHYIHHLNVTVNRGLYLIWWDVVFGSYRDNHPLVPEADSVLARCPSGRRGKAEESESPEHEEEVLAYVDSSFGATKKALVRELSIEQRARFMQRQKSSTDSAGEFVRQASGLVRQASGLVRQVSSTVRRLSSDRTVSRHDSFLRSKSLNVGAVSAGSTAEIHRAVLQQRRKSVDVPRSAVYSPPA